MEGLAGPEVRQLAEKVGEQPEQQTEAEKLVEFSVPSYQVNKTETRRRATDQNDIWKLRCPIMTEHINSKQQQIRSSDWDTQSIELTVFRMISDSCTIG